MATDPLLNPAQTRSHMGHSHGHHHHHDNTYLTSKNKNDAGVKITRVGLFINVGMAVGKGVGGYVFHSQALMADAIHSLTDLISDLTTLATISYSLRSPTTRFPTGYGKIESLGALGVSAFLLSGGIMIGLQATLALTQQMVPESAQTLVEHMASFVDGHGHGHGHSHTGHDGPGPDINAAWLAGGSIVVKEWLYRATMRVAREKNSSVLAGNAYHHRVDGLSALVALVTIAAGHWLASARWLDPIGGLAISLMIVRAGWSSTKAALLELADVGIDAHIKRNVNVAARPVLERSRAELFAVQGIKSGQNYLVEIAVAVPSSWTLGRMKELEDAVRVKVSSQVRGVKRVAVRFVDEESKAVGFGNEFVAFDKNVSPVEHEHDHDHDHNHGRDHSHEHSDSDVGTNKASKRK